MRFNLFKKGKKRIHLDYASATPIHMSVRKAMEPFLHEDWANPSAIYAEGVAVRAHIDGARTELAQLLRVRPQDVTFTSGGTEANNLALIGVVEKIAETCAYSDVEVLTTAIEHPSILETLEYLKKRGVAVTYVPVNNDGLIDLVQFKSLLNSRVKLCTFAYVNSEVGVIQDIKKITRIVRKWNEEHSVHVYVHTDASQAPLWLSCALDTLGVDLMTLDAGKCYGPKGVGVLVHRHWVTLLPTTHGGGQERGLRSGTESTMLIVGCVRALVWAQEGYETRSFAVAKLR
ncbi:MAG: aminotransferase class V-fold PLP-dependent enzyme, partial [Candidatus Kaiserbacteria bacterium]|nr:aminotransferase class V-fold PLP-dependent enzyme [Candidatus Kaiserbacteria bacterium]